MFREKVVQCYAEQKKTSEVFEPVCWKYRSVLVVDCSQYEVSLELKATSIMVYFCSSVEILDHLLGVGITFGTAWNSLQRS